MSKVIQWKHGTTAQSVSFTGQEKEITIDDDLHTIRVHNGSIAGGTVLAKLTELPTRLSQLTDDVGVWRSSELTKLSQLTNDKGFRTKTSLTKISQLTNDRNYLTGHCSYCSYCTYCSQCSNCHNCTTVDCTTVNCTTVNCTTVKCAYYDYCSACQCGDDN